LWSRRAGGARRTGRARRSGRARGPGGARWGGTCPPARAVGLRDVARRTPLRQLEAGGEADDGVRGGAGHRDAGVSGHALDEAALRGREIANDVDGQVRRTAADLHLDLVIRRIDLRRRRDRRELVIREEHHGRREMERRTLRPKRSLNTRAMSGSSLPPPVR